MEALVWRRREGDKFGRRKAMAFLLVELKKTGGVILEIHVERWGGVNCASSSGNRSAFWVVIFMCFVLFGRVFGFWYWVVLNRAIKEGGLFTRLIGSPVQFLLLERDQIHMFSIIYGLAPIFLCFCKLIAYNLKWLII